MIFLIIPNLIFRRIYFCSCWEYFVYLTARDTAICTLQSSGVLPVQTNENKNGDIQTHGGWGLCLGADAHMYDPVIHNVMKYLFLTKIS